MTKEYLLAELNQRVACLRSTDPQIINVLFLFHVLNNEKWEKECVDNSNGMAQKNLSTVWLSQYETPLLPLEKQERIVAELEGYRKVIEGAHQILASYKPTIRIDPAWPVSCLEEVAEMKRRPFGGLLKKEIFVRKGFKVYEQKHAIQRNVNIGEYFIDADKYKEMRAFAIAPGDIIISCSCTMGRVYLLPSESPPGVINQALLKLCPQHKYIDERQLEFRSNDN